MAISLKQSSYTGEITPVVRLVTFSRNPVGTLLAAWHGTRNSDSLNPEYIQRLYDDHNLNMDWYIKEDISEEDANLRATAREILRAFPDDSGKTSDDFKKVIKDNVIGILKYNIPPAEAVQFTFEIDNVSVAWREQLVRGRLAQNFWTQSTRPMDMTTMDISRNKSIELFGGEKAVEIYNNAANMIRETYKQLTEMGIPQEDIRLQPQMHVHRVYWFVSLRSLITVLSKRCDWIAQASLWTPIIGDIVMILREIGLYDILENFIGKPMCKTSTLDGIKYVYEYQNVLDCKARMSGVDPAPIDPLYLSYVHKVMPEHTDIKFYDYLKSMFIKIWNDDILEILHWDRNNPDTIGPYDRPRSWFYHEGRQDEVKYLEDYLGEGEEI